MVMEYTGRENRAGRQRLARQGYKDEDAKGLGKYETLGRYLFCFLILHVVYCLLQYAWFLVMDSGTAATPTLTGIHRAGRGRMRLCEALLHRGHLAWNKCRK